MATNPYESLADQMDQGPGSGAPTAAAPDAPAAPAPPPSSSSSNPYDSVTDELDRQNRERDRFTAWRATHPAVAPQRVGQVLQYSTASGLGPDFVDQHLDEVKQQVSQRQLEQALSTHPNLAEWMAEDPNRAALAREDVKPLSTLEWWLTGRNITQRRWTAGDIATAASAVAVPGMAPLAYLKTVAGQEQQPGWVEAAGRGAANIYGGLLRTWRSVRDLIPDKYVSPETQQEIDAGLRPDLAADQKAGAWIDEQLKAIDLWNQDSAVREKDQGFARTAASKVAAFLPNLLPLRYLTGALGVTGYFTATGAGDEIEHMRELRNEGGERLLSDNEARIWGLATSAASSYLSARWGDAFLGGASRFAGVTSGAASDAMEQLLSTATVPQLRQAAAGAFGTHVLSGIAMMASQSMASAAGEELSRIPHGERVQLSRVYDAMVRGAQEGAWLLPFSAWSVGREYLHNVGQLTELQLAQQKLDNAAKSAAQSKLLEEHPEVAEQLFGRLAQDSPVVYVKKAAWDEFAASKKIDPAALATRVVGDDGRAYHDAATDGDLKIPMPRYLSQVAKFGIHEALRDDVRLSQEGLTGRQAKEAEERLAERAQKLQVLSPEGMQEGQRAVYDDFKAKALEAVQDRGGTPRQRADREANADAVARTVAAFYAAQAEVLRTTPDELYARTADVRILQGGGPATGARLGQPVPLSETARGLTQGYQALPEAEQFARYYRDATTGLPNERALRDLPPDPARPLTAHWKVQGTAYANDQLGGHQAGDNLYRAAARALSSATDLVAKVGGDFAGRVATREEAAAIAERANAEMDRLGFKGFKITADAGPSLQEAARAHTAEMKRLEEGGQRARRGQRPAGVPEGFAPPQVAHLEVAPPGQLQEAFGKLSPEERAQRLYVEPASGLLTGEGWAAAPRKAHEVTFDVNGLGFRNQELGNVFGDETLKKMGQIMAHLGGAGFDAAHIHGDEFKAQSDDPEALRAFAERVRTAAESVKVEMYDPNTHEVVSANGTGIAYGQGQGAAAAEAALNAHKDELAAAGLRDRKGESAVERARVARRPATDEEAARADRHLSGQDQGVGAGDLGRGVQPEGGGGAEGAGEGRQAPLVRLNAERGYIEFSMPEEGKPRRFDIHLLEGADLSTLAHETGHMLGEVFFDLARAGDAPEGLAHDADALAKWMGYGSAADRTATLQERAELGRVEGRGQGEERRLRELTAREEKLSHAWEQYLAEGKSPSAELTPVFARFKGWMLRIYQAIENIGRQYAAKHGKGLGLTPEVRQIFDRWLAVEPAIEQARGREGNPLEAAGLSPQELEEDRQMVEQAKAESQRRLLEQIAEEQRKSDASFYRDEEDRIRAEVEEAVGKERPYQALEYFKTGEHPNAAALQGLKLDRAEVKARYGAEFAATLPRYLFAEKGTGLSPDDLAPALGYKTGDEMIREIEAAEPRDVRVAILTGYEMADQYPTLLTSPERMGEAAVDQVHNASEAALTLSRLRQFVDRLVPEMGQEVKLLSQGGLRALALRLVGEKRIGELSPAAILTTERQAAKEAYEFAQAGRHREAADAMVRQAIAQAMYGDAKQSQHRAEVLEGALRRGDTAGSRDRLLKAGQEYSDVVASILERLGMRAPGDSSERVGIDALLAKMEKQAQTADFDVAELRSWLNSGKDPARTLTPKGNVSMSSAGWRALTLPEAQNLHDAVLNLRAIAKNLNEVEIRGKKYDRKATIDKIREEASVLPLQAQPKADLGVKTPILDALISVQAWDAALLRSRLPIDWLGQTAHQAIWERYIDSRNLEDRLAAKVQAKINDSWEQVPEELQRRRYDLIDGSELPIETQGGARTREWLWMVTLNMMNDGNAQRLTAGYRWNPETVRDFIKKHLTPEEGKFLQGIVDVFDKDLWPELAAKETRVRGKAPPKVGPTPLELGDGTVLRGGYFPLKADPRTSTLGQHQATEAEIKSLSDFYGSEYQRAATAKGHTKSRADEASYQVNLQWSVIPGHVSQVIHDIAFDEMVRDVGQLLLDPDMQRVMQERIGSERAKGTMQWLRTVANSQSESVGGLMGRLFSSVAGVQNRLVQASIVGNVPVALAQFTHPLVAMAAGEISPRYAVPAMLKALSPSARELATRLSPEIQHREGLGVRQLDQELRDIGPQGDRRLLGSRLLGTAAERARRMGAVVMDTADHLVSTCIWTAAYDRAVAAGDHDAGRTADDVLNKVMPPRDQAEKSPFLRSPLMSKLLMFHGFFNTMYGLNRQVAHESMLDFAQADGASEYARAGGGSLVAAGRMLGVALFGIIAGEYLAGHGKDDDEDWGQFLMRRAIAAPFQFLPFVGAPAEQLSNRLVTGKRGDVSVRQAPALAQIDHLFKAFDRALSENDNRTDEDKLFSMFEGASTTFGLPTKQPLRTGRYLYDLATGATEPRGLGDVLSGLVYGEHEHQASNPLKDLQTSAE